LKYDPLLQQPSLSTVSRTSRPRSPRNFLFSVGGGPYGCDESSILGSQFPGISS
jgi:hypothetical protein